MDARKIRTPRSLPVGPRQKRRLNGPRLLRMEAPRRVFGDT
jgi:hypothetical protein